MRPMQFQRGHAKPLFGDLRGLVQPLIGQCVLDLLQRQQVVAHVGQHVQAHLFRQLHQRTRIGRRRLHRTLIMLQVLPVHVVFGLVGPHCHERAGRDEGGRHQVACELFRLHRRSPLNEIRPACQVIGCQADMIEIIPGNKKQGLHAQLIRPI